MRLKGKTAVVTAAGAGIGKATAVAFVEQGAHVIATDISNESFAELQHLGIETYQLDVLDAHSVKGFAEKCTEVDILFNCAGYVHHDGFRSLSVLGTCTSRFPKTFSPE